MKKAINHAPYINSHSLTHLITSTVIFAACGTSPTEPIDPKREYSCGGSKQGIGFLYKPTPSSNWEAYGATTTTHSNGKTTCSNSTLLIDGSRNWTEEEARDFAARNWKS
jgi:hypothetical protein